MDVRLDYVPQDGFGFRALRAFMSGYANPNSVLMRKS